MSDGPVIKGIFSGLTPAEKVYLIAHPHHLSTIRDAADKALREARRLFPGRAQHNGTGDAFRHCFWSSLLARDIGVANASQFTTAHEAYSANPPDERAMDLHNNSVGHEIGRYNPRATDAGLSMLCKSALDAGKLLTVPPATGAPY